MPTVDRDHEDARANPGELVFAVHVVLEALALLERERVQGDRGLACDRGAAKRCGLAGDRHDPSRYPNRASLAQGAREAPLVRTSGLGHTRSHR